MPVHDPDFAMLPLLVLGAEPVFLDIGANRGQSIHSIKGLLPNAIVHSFEPNPRMHMALDEAAAQYERVMIHKFGLSDTESDLVFYLPSLNGVDYFEEVTMEPAELEKPWVKARWVERGGDPVIRPFVAPVKVGDALGHRPDFIKIDVEGAESYVISGLLKTLTEFRPPLLVENSDYKRVTDILSGLGYRPMQPNELGTGLVPLAGARTNTFYVQA